MTDTRGRVRIYEVGPRDGLQNEATPIPTEAKARFVALLAAAGLREIEATSFVSPSAIPQLADADELMAVLDRPDGVRFPVLVPNQRGMDRAEAAGVDAIAVFTAASDAFTARNIGMTVEESLTTFAPVLGRARDLGWWTRGYVSTAFGCPYTGRVEPARAVEVAVRLVELGVDEVCFGDTIGVGVPGQVEELTGLTAQAGIPLDRVAYHFHDTRGTALANVAAGLHAGIRCFDSAAGGTGAVRTRPVRPATSPPRTWCTCSTPRAGRPGCRLRASSRRLGSSRASSAGRLPRRSARPGDGTRRPGCRARLRRAARHLPAMRLPGIAARASTNATFCYIPARWTVSYSF